MPRINPRRGRGREKRRCGERRQRVRKNEYRGRPFGLAKFASDIAEVFVLAPIDQDGGEFWYATGENVPTESRARNANDDHCPWIQVEFDQENHQHDPGGRRENRDGIDRQRRQEDKKVCPHSLWWFLSSNTRALQERAQHFFGFEKFAGDFARTAGVP